MKARVLILFVYFSSQAFTQDSLVVGKRFTLPEVRYSLCIKWGENWEKRAMEEEYAVIFDSLAQFIRENKHVCFEICVHTDVRGSDTANLKWSQKRADDWRNPLLERGVDSTQLVAKGYGESRPSRVWLKDSVFYTYDPGGNGVEMLVLTEEYIQLFRENKWKFEMLHAMNRREELLVVSVQKN